MCGVRGEGGYGDKKELVAHVRALSLPRHGRPLLSSEQTRAGF